MFTYKTIKWGKNIIKYIQILNHYETFNTHCQTKLVYEKLHKKKLQTKPFSTIKYLAQIFKFGCLKHLFRIHREIYLIKIKLVLL